MNDVLSRRIKSTQETQTMINREIREEISATNVMTRKHISGGGDLSEDALKALWSIEQRLRELYQRIKA